MTRTKFYITLTAALCVSLSAPGKEAVDTLSVPSTQFSMEKLIRVTDSLTKNYRFSEAAGLFETAKAGADSLSAILIDEAMIQAQNGDNMTGFCSNPVAVARERFSLNDFFLFYPLKDHSWRNVPNQLDSLGGDPFARAIYFPDGSEEVYWSAKDQDGIRNIYHSHHRDTLWTVPELINEQMTTSSDEIYPMLSPDGKQLFFASKGLYGMGGYDLYVSNWDDNLNDWGVPVNMGFPYSSPYDDFLFINTADGKYSMFASNRNCSRDSVDVYVLEFDSTPIRKAVRDPRELRKLCALDPVNDPARIDSKSAVSESVQVNADMRRYSTKMQEVRSLRDALYKYSTSADETERSFIPKLRDSLDVASKELQKIELEFLKKGVSVDPEKLQQEADKEVIGTSGGYTFTKNSMGKSFRIDLEQPKKSFDYTFQVLPEGRFAEDNTLPEGLVYQIQIFSMSSKATVKQIKGLSPVFERFGTNGRRIYSVGLFRSYKDVLSNLNKVKRVGFRSAIIVAFLNGKTITVTKARSLEKSVHEMFQIRIYPTDGNALTETNLMAVKAISSADLARTTEGGIVSYLLGPFDSRSEAETIISALKTAGMDNIRIESAGLSEVKE